MVLESLTQPSWLTLAMEPGRAMGETLWLRQMRALLPNDRIKDPHGVMIIPGFLGDDSYSLTLRQWLEQRGYEVVGWEQGTNRGPRPDTFRNLARTAHALADKTGHPVSLIGHSLGGIYARELAKQIPGAIRQTISVGSPLSSEDGEGRASPVTQIFTAFNPEGARHWASEGSIEHAPPVPNSTIFSMTDGVIAWRRAIQHEGHQQSENIAVFGSHGGMLHNAMVWIILADRLRMKPGDWQPYAPPHMFAGFPCDPASTRSPDEAAT